MKSKKHDGTIVKMKNGKLRFMISVNGKRYSKVCNNIEEIEEYKNELLGKSKDDNISVKCLADKWLNHCKLDYTISNSTIEGYKNGLVIIDKYIGDVKVKNLNVGVIQDFIDRMLKDKYKVGTINHRLGILRNICKYAYVHNYTEKNVYDIDLIKKPKDKSEEKVILDDEEVKLILDYYDKKYNKPWNVMIRLSLLGLRRGEVLGLLIEDCFLDDIYPYIKITGQYVKEFDENKMKKVSVRKNICKTEKSRRNVYIVDNELVKMIKDIIGERKKGLIFVKDNGEGLDCENYSQKFKLVVERLKIKKNVSIHSLRHYAASKMIKNNCDVKTVADVLGHSSFMTTLKVYAHSDDKSKIEAMKKLKL